MGTFKTWMDHHSIYNDKDLVEYQKIFYKLDKKMKKIHDAGYYVSSFDPNDIIVNGKHVNYVSVNKIDDNYDYVHANIYTLSNLAIGIYSGINTFIKSGFLKHKYDDFVLFIPKDIEPYYRGIILRDATVYLSDYMRAKKDREVKDTQNELNSNNRKLNKSTMVGRLYSEDDNNTVGFAYTFIIPGIIFFLAILIPLLIALSS